MSFESVLNESEFSTIVLENRSAYEQDLLGFNELLQADYLCPDLGPNSIINLAV